MASFRSLLCLLLGFVAFPAHQPQQQVLVQAQYVQSETWQQIPDPNSGTGFSMVPFWRPTTLQAPERVVDIWPEVVFLEYNCQYMVDICRNAENWFNTQRGSTRVPKYRFGYDFNTGKGSQFRSTGRRRQSCPGSWKNSHPCPETNQGTVMRHDGPWYHNDLEPGTTINQIRNYRPPNGGAVQLSKVRYTCDEFPPATWIQGGSGHAAPEAGAEDAETRCAAFRCVSGVKAEQNWQAEAHGKLQGELKAVITRRQNDFGHFPFYQPKNSVVLFMFRTTTAVNGIAAKIYTYTDASQSNERHPPITVSQAKRSLNETADREAFWAWADTVTMEELEAMGPGSVMKQHVHANNSMENLDPPVGLHGAWLAMMAANHGQSPAPRGRAPKRAFNKRQGSADAAVAPLVRNATTSDLEKARKIVEEALAKSAELNKARLANPLRNKYALQPGTVTGGSGQRMRRRADEVEMPPPLLNITDEIAAAAALVSEAEATNLAGNFTRRQVQATAGTYWMEQLQRKGTVPWGDDPSYKVFRNVMDYGAKGDGVTDDTKAIKSAMNDQNRCGKNCNGSTTKNAIIYFPPGTYRISSTIPMPFGTQVIGDANDWPTLAASKNFIGLGVLSADEYTGGGTGPDGRDQQWFINTGNFYRQVRNLKIDITQTRPVQEVAGLHYQVAQATSIQNVEIIAQSGTTQRGIFAENGSGGVISDITFRGGKFGLYGGNQQFTAQRLTFIGCDTGVQLIWDWGWVWKSITMTNVGVGFRLLQEETSPTSKRQTIPGKGGDNGNIGSVSFIDSSFQNVETAVLMAPPNEEPGSGSTGVVIENVDFQGVAKAVADTTGKTLLASSGKVDHWALGPVYKKDGPDFSTGAKIGNFRRAQDLLDSKGSYFERPKPQYENRPVGDFVHVKDFGAKGDGVTDDTAAFQTALYSTQGKILFVDAGSYILTGTVMIPIGSKIVGETWSQLVASGPYFSDATNPQVMIKVGNDGNVGDIEMQDLIFTNRGPTAGLILVEWNIRAANPGSAALWDCHVRIGGATGTELTPDECPALTTGIAQGCNAASLMMHITSRASGYFENMWLWVSDHDIDDPDLVDANNTMVQNSVYVARGLLIESVEPTWLYGTSSEHAVFYQYNFHQARNIFAGMIQTESPYYQPTPPPPAPFEAAVGKMNGDPDYECTAGDEFSGCDESWGVIMRECANVFVAGAGVYSWFSTYTQDCIDEHACQKALILLEDNYVGVRIQHLITIGAKYMAVMDGVGIKALDYLNVESHPRWSQISVLDVGSSGNNFTEAIWVDPKIWDMDEPSFTCSPPCVVRIPPWTKATRVVDYPKLTVTDGSWSTTITRAPLTITQVNFDVVTIENNAGAVAGNKQRRAAQGFAPFWPTPATTPYWPGVTYTDRQGNVVATTPTIPFPAPPASIGPDAPPPLKGFWPKRWINPIEGFPEEPLVPQCDWLEFGCIQTPWDQYGGMPDPDFPSDDDENWEDASVTCPAPSSTSSTSTKTTQTTTKEEPTPTESPYEIGRPMDNVKHCYNDGQKATNGQMQGAANSFCNGLGSEGRLLRAEAGSTYVYSRRFDPPANGQWPIHIDVKFSLRGGCEWPENYDECRHYLRVAIDSCNCEGENGKQGGTVDNRCYSFKMDPQTFG